MILDDQTRLELIQLLKQAVAEAVEHHPLSDDEIRWVRLAIQSEVERADLRKAIIQKSLAGLVWMAICGAGILMWSGLKDFIK